MNRPKLNKFIFLIFLFLTLTQAQFSQKVDIFKDTWKDTSPHREKFVKINGQNLHYLDWGGNGETLLFLAGGSHSAHIFDDLAPEFTDRFRVLALTRRGHGQSDKPENGYDAKTLTEDLRGFLDELKIKRVILAGHSLAGTEMTLFANLYKERVAKLVYLDSALDFKGMSAVFKDSPARNPPKEALESFEGYRAFFKSQKCGWSDAWEADLRQTIVFDSGGKPVRRATPAKINKQIWDGMDAAATDYAKIKVPALAFYALDPFAACFLPANLSAQEAEKARGFVADYSERWRQSAARFKREMPAARIVEVPDSDHWFFVQNKERVVREMREFLIPASQNKNSTKRDQKTSGFAEVSGGRLYYETAGRGEETIVFVHGGLVDSRLWDEQFDEFAKKYRVVCYDLRGYGRSQPLPDKAFSPVEDLARLLNFLKIERATIVGLSLGGVISTDFALERPEMVERLVLVGAGLRGFKSKPSEKTINLFREAAKAAPEKAAELWLQNDLFAALKNKPKARSRILKMLADNHRMWTTVTDDKYVFPKTLSIERLDKIAAPTLVVLGAIDAPDLLAIGRVLDEKIPDSQIVTMSDASHHPNLEKPEEFNRILRRFLKEVSIGNRAK